MVGLHTKQPSCSNKGEQTSLTSICGKAKGRDPN